MKLSGEAGDLNFAIGGIVSPNLALHAILYGWLVQDPDVEVSGFSNQAQWDLELGCPEKPCVASSLPDSDDSPKAGGPARLV